MLRKIGESIWSLIFGAIIFFIILRYVLQYVLIAVFLIDFFCALILVLYVGTSLYEKRSWREIPNHILAILSVACYIVLLIWWHLDHGIKDSYLAMIDGYQLGKGCTYFASNLCDFWVAVLHLIPFLALSVPPVIYNFIKQSSFKQALLSVWEDATDFTNGKILIIAMIGCSSIIAALSAFRLSENETIVAFYAAPKFKQREWLEFPFDIHGGEIDYQQQNGECWYSLFPFHISSEKADEIRSRATTCFRNELQRVTERGNLATTIGDVRKACFDSLRVLVCYQ